jgi:hypothetical protein
MTEMEMPHYASGMSAGPEEPMSMQGGFLESCIARDGAGYAEPRESETGGLGRR